MQVIVHRYRDARTGRPTQAVSVYQSLRAGRHAWLQLLGGWIQRLMREFGPHLTLQQAEHAIHKGLEADDPEVVGEKIREAEAAWQRFWKWRDERELGGGWGEVSVVRTERPELVLFEDVSISDDAPAAVAPTAGARRLGQGPFWRPGSGGYEGLRRTMEAWTQSPRKWLLEDIQRPVRPASRQAVRDLVLLHGPEEETTIEWRPGQTNPLLAVRCAVIAVEMALARVPDPVVRGQRVTVLFPFPFAPSADWGDLFPPSPEASPEGAHRRLLKEFLYQVTEAAWAVIDAAWPEASRAEVARRPWEPIQHALSGVLHIVYRSHWWFPLADAVRVLTLAAQSLARGTARRRDLLARSEQAVNLVLQSIGLYAMQTARAALDHEPGVSADEASTLAWGRRGDAVQRFLQEWTAQCWSAAPLQEGLEAPINSGVGSRLPRL